MKEDFWQNWKRKTNIEKKAIESVRKTRRLILRVVPKDKIHSIYIKGSFVRREMKRESDVDIVPIVTDNKSEKPVFGVNDHKIFPCIVVPLSLWELKTNKLFTPSNGIPDTRAKPDRFLFHLEDYKLIYGKPIKSEKYKIRDHKTALKDEIKIFREGYIYFYRKKYINFEVLLKETFWLIELEQYCKGKKFEHSFKGIKRAVKNKSHIVHEAYKLRNSKTISHKQKEAFVDRLERYLDKLEDIR